MKKNEQNILKAIKYYQLAVNTANPIATYDLACLYYKENNIPKAIELYKLAFDRNIEYAFSDLVRICRWY